MTATLLQNKWQTVEEEETDLRVAIVSTTKVNQRIKPEGMATRTTSDIDEVNRCALAGLRTFYHGRQLIFNSPIRRITYERRNRQYKLYEITTILIYQEGAWRPYEVQEQWGLEFEIEVRDSPKGEENAKT